MDTAAPSIPGIPGIPNIPRIPPDALAARLGSANSPLLLDVRREAKFAASAHLLSGALRCAPEHVAAFARAQPPGEVVVYCVYGHNVSHDAAAELCAAGWSAAMLAGGFESGQEGVDTEQDIARWRAQRLPTVLKRPDWGVTGEQASRWITRERPKIDRIACAWLIRRCIDPRAEFFYVPTPRVSGEAHRLNAVGYGAPGAPVSYEGELCSFDALLRTFELRDAALDMLATIVRGADTDRLELAPQSAGLLDCVLGLSRLHAGDDQALLRAGLLLYDALYAGCRSARDKPHKAESKTLPGAAQ